MPTVERKMVQVRLPVKLAREAKVLCVSRDLSMQEVIERLLKLYCQKPTLIEI